MLPAAVWVVRGALLLFGIGAPLNSKPPAAPSGGVVVSAATAEFIRTGKQPPFGPKPGGKHGGGHDIKGQGPSRNHVIFG